jgi:hypothetical protein
LARDGAFDGRDDVDRDADERDDEARDAEREPTERELPERLVVVPARFTFGGRLVSGRDGGVRRLTVPPSSGT